MANPTQLGRMLELSSGKAEPYQEGIALTMVVLSVVGYLILRVWDLCCDGKQKEWKFYQKFRIFVKFLKAGTFFFVGLITMIEIFDKNVLTYEFKLCIALVALFESIDEVFDALVEVK